MPEANRTATNKAQLFLARRSLHYWRAVDGESGVVAMRSQVHEGRVVACAMKRKLGPIFNAANDAVEQALQQTSRSDDNG
jgi:hypothetical protein